MDSVEWTYAGAWTLNLVLAGIFNLPQLGHAMGELLVFAAIFFLFAAPLHLLCGASVWTLYRAECACDPVPGAAKRAVGRFVCAESLLFWAGYWAMVFGVVPLQIRL